MSKKILILSIFLFVLFVSFTKSINAISCTKNGTAWTCPATTCNGCKYDSGTVSCSTTTYYCNYTSSIANDCRCCSSVCSSAQYCSSGTCTCTSGTGGSTPSNCGSISGYNCTGVGTCCQYTWACRSGSCTNGCHDSTMANSLCCGTNGTCSGSGTCSYPTCNVCSCGSCSVSCGGGTQSCSCTSYSSGGNCNTTSYSQSCNTQSCGGTLSGNVYNDANRNGIKDAGEVGISGATVSNGLTTATTDASGNYSFLSLSGTYSISVTNKTASYTNADIVTNNGNAVSLNISGATTQDFGLANPCDFPSTGNYTVKYSCTSSLTSIGVSTGSTLTISSGVTLTIGNVSNQTLYYSSLILNGTILINKGTSAKIQKR